MIIFPEPSKAFFPFSFEAAQHEQAHFDVVVIRTRQQGQSRFRSRFSVCVSAPAVGAKGGWAIPACEVLPSRVGTNARERAASHCPAADGVPTWNKELRPPNPLRVSSEGGVKNRPGVWMCGQCWQLGSAHFPRRVGQCVHTRALSHAHARGLTE